MHLNRATIYSNGIADFQRAFRIEGNKSNPISIPVRQQHLGDVLASLTVSGLVRIVSPPSYQPANQDDGSISINTGDALIMLAQQLAGAEAEIGLAGSTMIGKVVGIHTQQIATSGEPVDEQLLVMLTEKGISKIEFRQIEHLQFTDAAVRTEINKALNRRLRDIKPNSTFVDLELETDEESTDAIIQYTIPAAAWKISYRILINDEGPIELHGHAIVDNNTDEDWKDFIIAVVMGQPISFTTDLATSKIPKRSHVDIVQESAIGAVEVEEKMVMMAMSEAPMASRALDWDSSDAMESGAVPRSARRSEKRVRSAQIEEADVSESGDFCIFESAGPVSIDARRSAVIPVFATTIDQSKPVLHFKTENHPERPFRSLRFVNSTPHSLGRGVCTVYEGTTYAGSCILPATQPDVDALLPHALETAVRVRPTPATIQKRRIGIRISDGVVYESHHNLAKTEYLVHSDRDESFEFMIDHPLRLAESDVEIQLIRDGADPVLLDSHQLKNGNRIEFELMANDVIAIHVVETKVSVSRISLATKSRDGAFNTHWLFDNFAESNSPLSDDPAVSRCIEISLALDSKEKEIVEVEQKIKLLTHRQTRLRENIKTGATDHQTGKWQSDLADAENRIVSLEEEQLPQIRDMIKDLRLQLFEALKGLALEWKEP